MEKFDVEIVYQHLKENYPGNYITIADKGFGKTFHYEKFCLIWYDEINIYDKTGNSPDDLWPEYFETYDELFQKIYEIVITKDTIFRKHLLSKQREQRIDDILND